MEIAVRRTVETPRGPGEVLPIDRGRWPPAALDAYRSVLRELDHWSREHDDGLGRNAWIAEEAVRHSW